MAANVPVIVIDDDEEDVKITSAGVCAATAPMGSGGVATWQHLSNLDFQSAELARAQYSASKTNYGGNNSVSHHEVRIGNTHHVSGSRHPTYQSFLEAASGAGPYENAAAQPLPNIPGYMAPEQAASCAVPEQYPQPGVDELQTGTQISPTRPFFTFTPKFFSEMANQIMYSFPYEDFAGRHRCSVEQVEQALLHSVMSSLVWEDKQPKVQMEVDYPGNQNLGVNEPVSYMDTSDQASLDTLQRELAQADNGNSNHIHQVDPHLIDPELMNLEEAIPVSDPKPTNDVENAQPIYNERTVDHPPIDPSHEATKKRRRSESQGETTRVSPITTSSQHEEFTAQPKAGPEKPSPPKKVKKAGGAFVPTAANQPPPRLSARAQEVVSAVAAAIVDKANAVARKESLCQRQPREKTLYEVATAKDKEFWTKYMRDPCSRMRQGLVLAGKGPKKGGRGEKKKGQRRG